VSPPSTGLEDLSKSPPHFDTFQQRVDAFDRSPG
jgi:hypothetical protein